MISHYVPLALTCLLYTSQERLKDLRVERGLTLEQLAEQTHLSKSALGSYEADDFKDISHYALIKLARYYGVTADYLLGLSETKSHPNADLADLRLSDDMIEPVSYTHLFLRIFVFF